MVAEVTCAQCNRPTHRTPNNQDLRAEATLRVSLTANNTSFKDLIRDAFAENATDAQCRSCEVVTPRSARWRLHTAPEVLIVDVDQVDFNTKSTVKLGFKVPTIPAELDLDDYLYDKANNTTRYRLMGVLNHRGINPTKGHYLSHVRDVSGNWFRIDGDAVTSSSVVQLQAYNPKLQANQMIPRLIAYVKMHDGEDFDTIATRAINLKPGPRAFQQPQIVYDDSMTLAALKALCNEHDLLPGRVTSEESIKGVIDRANAADSTFKTRRKPWLIKTLLTTGTGAAINTNATKIQLAAQLAALMTTQPARVPAAPTTSGPAEGPDPPTGGPAAPPTDIQTTLDAANARIVALEAQLAAVNLPCTTISNTGTDPRAPIPITTDLIRELIRQPPASPRLPRGTKRPAEEAVFFSTEREKRGAIQLADRACEAINEGIRLAPASAPTRSQTGDGSPSYTANSEKQPPSCSAITSQTKGTPGSNLQCHECLIFEGEIHHMHANVCGWVPGTRIAPPMASEVRERARGNRYGA